MNQFPPTVYQGVSRPLPKAYALRYLTCLYTSNLENDEIPGNEIELIKRYLKNKCLELFDIMNTPMFIPQIINTSTSVSIDILDRPTFLLKCDSSVRTTEGN